jgi:hypothetical protein
MGCILYELAMGEKAFSSDFAVHLHSLSGTNLNIVLDETYDEDSVRSISGSIQSMLQIEAASRPSASALSEKIRSHYQTRQVFTHDQVQIHHVFSHVRKPNNDLLNTISSGMPTMLPIT